MTSFADLDREYRKICGELAEWPLEWVEWAYDWGYGDLEGFDGPDVWQEGFLREWGEDIRARGFDFKTPVEPIRFSTTSGHGIGKSGLVAFGLVGFIMSTRPHAKGIVTANTSPQLETKTWAEIAKWVKRMKTRRWFRLTSGRGSMKMVHRNHPETWRMDGMAWRENQPEAFAGLHAANSTPFYIFDEASGIPKAIFETANGGMTDGEPMMFLFSNPTKASGYFYESHHELRHRFKCRQIDSRTARMTNKQEIKNWIEDYGIDSDFVKVRVLGEFPVTSDRQFIATNLVTAAMEKDREEKFGPLDPVIMGVDVARYGSDESTIYVRRGRSLRWYPPKIFRGLDNMQLAFEIKKIADEIHPDAINIDSGGGAGPIDALRLWNVPNVNEIGFGSPSPDDDYVMMATFMMAEFRKWLKQDGVTLPNDPILKRQIIGREYSMVEGKRGTAIKIESKDEMRDHQDKKESPDRADGCCLTFAVPVGPRDLERTKAEIRGERQVMVVGLD